MDVSNQPVHPNLPIERSWGLPLQNHSTQDPLCEIALKALKNSAIMASIDKSSNDLKNKGLVVAPKEILSAVIKNPLLATVATGTLDAYADEQLGYTTQEEQSKQFLSGQKSKIEQANPLGTGVRLYRQDVENLRQHCDLIFSQFSEIYQKKSEPEKQGLIAHLTSQLVWLAGVFSLTQASKAPPKKIISDLELINTLIQDSLNQRAVDAEKILRTETDKLQVIKLPPAAQIQNPRIQQAASTVLKSVAELAALELLSGVFLAAGASSTLAYAVPILVAGGLSSTVTHLLHTKERHFKFENYEIVEDRSKGIKNEFSKSVVENVFTSLLKSKGLALIIGGKTIGSVLLDALFPHAMSESQKAKLEELSAKIVCERFDQVINELRENDFELMLQDIQFLVNAIINNEPDEATKEELKQVFNSQFGLARVQFLQNLKANAASTHTDLENDHLRKQISNLQVSLMRNALVYQIYKTLLNMKLTFNSATHAGSRGSSEINHETSQTQNPSEPPEQTSEPNIEKMMVLLTQVMQQQFDALRELTFKSKLEEIISTPSTHEGDLTFNAFHSISVSAKKFKHIQALEAEYALISSPDQMKKLTKIAYQEKKILKRAKHEAQSLLDEIYGTPPFNLGIYNSLESIIDEQTLETKLYGVFSPAKIVAYKLASDQLERLNCFPEEYLEITGSGLSKKQLLVYNQMISTASQNKERAKTQFALRFKQAVIDHISKKQPLSPDNTSGRQPSRLDEIFDACSAIQSYCPESKNDLSSLLSDLGPEAERAIETDIKAQLIDILGRSPPLTKTASGQMLANQKVLYKELLKELNHLRANLNQFGKEATFIKPLKVEISLLFQFLKGALQQVQGQRVSLQQDLDNLKRYKQQKLKPGGVDSKMPLSPSSDNLVLKKQISSLEDAAAKKSNKLEREFNKKNSKTLKQSNPKMKPPKSVRIPRVRRPRLK